MAEGLWQVRREDMMFQAYVIRHRAADETVWQRKYIGPIRSGRRQIASICHATSRRYTTNEEHIKKLTWLVQTSNRICQVRSRSGPIFTVAKVVLS